MGKIMWFVILWCLLLSPVTAQADSQQSELDFDDMCNLSNITGANIAAEWLFAESNYTAPSYKTGTHGQPDGYPKDTENRSNLSQPKKRNLKTLIYVIHDVPNSFPMFSNAEFVSFTIVGDTITLTLDNNASYDGVCNLSDIMGSNISAAGTSVELEYFPITYRNLSFDNKWASVPYFNDTENRLYLLSGSGMVTKFEFCMEENSTSVNKTIPKVVGVGRTVGQFQLETEAEGRNSNYNRLEANIKGVGHMDSYVQYAPDTSYENTTFIPTFLDCEKLQLRTISYLGPSSFIEPEISSTIITTADVLGIASGAEPVPEISHEWISELELDVEYFPITYRNYSYDQTWNVTPYFNSTTNRLYLFSGSGIAGFRFDMEENSTSVNKTIPKVVGVGDLVGQFQMETYAEGRNSTYNRLESYIKGVGYMDSYVQYAPDTSYENTTFIPTFLDCEKLQLHTVSLIEPGIRSGIQTYAEVLGIASGAEYLNFSNMPLDYVAIEEYFDLEYHPVNISGDIFDECWSVKPVQYDDLLVVLRGTGTVTTLFFSFNDSTATLPEIFSYGYLSGDYDISTNIFPHYMNVSATGTNVSAMDESGQGGFGIHFSEGPRNCTCGDICVDTTGWWRNGKLANASDTPLQHAVDNAIVGETICAKDGTYSENINVDKCLTIRAENGSAATIVQAASPSDHVFNVTANYVNISGFTAQNAICGIYLYNVGHCNISDNNVTNNSGGGIYMYNSSNNSLTGNHASANEHGIMLAYSSNNNSLSYNTAFNNTEDGIYMNNSNNNTLSSNTVNSNSDTGIYVDDSSNNTLLSNMVNSNSDTGIYVDDSSNNTLLSNMVNSNSDTGIYVDGSSNNTISSNTVNSNNGSGIVLWYSSSNLFSYNIAFNNSEDGIHLYHSSGNSLTNNTANSNYDCGIYLESSSNNLIYNNYFDNTNNAYDNGINIWNITPTLRTNTVRGSWLGGNYWSDYAGEDLEGDGLGDTLLPYNSSGNITNGGDWHPLVPVGVDVVVFRSGTWYVDTTGDYNWDYLFLFGLTPGDVPLVGDINRDGRDDTAIFRSGTWYVDTTGDHKWDDSFEFGLTPGDVPVVGDINQDGRDDTAIFRSGTWYVDTTGDHKWDDSFEFGLTPGDVPVVGDINQDGRDDTAIFRSGTWYVDTTGDHKWDISFEFGLTPGDVPVVGDINRDGRDDTAIFRSGTWYVDTTGDHKWDYSFKFGLTPGDVSVVGNIYEFAIEVNKTVWDPKTEEWVDGINANVSDKVRFKIWILNDGTSSLTNIAVNDTMSASLEYAAGKTTVNGEPCEPEEISGQCLKWYYNASKDCTSPFLNLHSGENITIEFNATKNRTSDDTNCVNVSAWYNETGSHVQVIDEDSAGVYGWFDDVAIFRSGTWYVDTEGNYIRDTGGWTESFTFGLSPGDVPVVGDINRDGRDDVAIFRSGTWYVDTTGDYKWDESFKFGASPGDVPVVGDINRDGKDDVAIFRSGTWYVDTQGNYINDAGGWTESFTFGSSPGDVPVVGDIKRDGTVDTAIFRSGTWYVDTEGNYINDAGGWTESFKFGLSPGDVPVVGDINRDGTADIAIFRSGTWYVDTEGNYINETGGWTESFTFGARPGDVPLVGDIK